MVCAVAPLSASTSPRSDRSLTSVVKLPAAMATSTTSPGKMTSSRTWITPLLAMTSAATTLTMLLIYEIWTPPSSVLIRSMTSPPRVSTGPVVTSAAGTVTPPTTCLKTIAKACSVVKLSRVPSGSFANASSDGANMVCACASLSASTSPRSDRSLTSVWKLPAAMATSTTSPSSGSPGKMTSSRTWITPLLAMTSAVTTLTMLFMYEIWTPPSSVLIRSMNSPPRVSTGPVVTSAARTVAPPTTCLKTIASACSGVKFSRVPSGSFANASSDGAKMVCAVAPLSASTSPRSDRSLTSVVKLPAAMATSTTSPGKMTSSRTWITPLLAMTSAATTLTMLLIYEIWTPPSSVLIRSMTSPPRVSTGPVVTSAAGTVTPPTTCLKTIAKACSVVKLSRVPSGSFANASSDGANMVCACASLSASTSPRSDRSLTSVWKLPAAMATSTTSPSSGSPGKMTSSRTWITPLLAMTSAVTTLTKLFMYEIWTPPASVLMRSMVSPPRVSTGPVVTSAARTVAPPTTCLKTIASACSGVKLSRVPSGSFANASSDGANMVCASASLSASTSPRSERSLTSVVKLPAAMATSTTSPSSGSASGKMTSSMTWITPLLAMTSAVTTLTTLPM